MAHEVHLTSEELRILNGKFGKAAQKAMEILVGLARIYQAPRLIPISSVQVAGVSYDNLGEAGLRFLERWADDGAKCVVQTTLNPAGMDIENWQNLGISPAFARQQMRVLEAYRRFGISPTCSCTPYLIGNLPNFGDHIAWSESSAVCYTNSVIGARTNREGGPSALASAIIGKTAEYGFHLEENRIPTVRVQVEAVLPTGDLRTAFFGLLGKIIGESLVASGKKEIPCIEGIEKASLEELKAFSASIATYGGLALFHIAGITPEAMFFSPPQKTITLTQKEIHQSMESLQKNLINEIEFFSLGCPHLSLREIEHIASLVKGKKVYNEFWLTTARDTKQRSDQIGYTAVIEASGIKFAADTCCVVAPIQGRFKSMATDSAKACYYGYAKNKFLTSLLPIELLISLATTPLDRRP